MTPAIADPDCESECFPKSERKQKERLRVSVRKRRGVGKIDRRKGDALRRDTLQRKRKVERGWGEVQQIFREKKTENKDSCQGEIKGFVFNKSVGTTY